MHGSLCVEAGAQRREDLRDVRRNSKELCVCVTVWAIWLGLFCSQTSLLWSLYKRISCETATRGPKRTATGTQQAGRAAQHLQQRATLASNMLQNMLDGDGQDQYDAGGWCFPKPIPPVQRNGEWVVS